MVGPSFIYDAKVRSVYDADTVRLDIDLGFGVWISNQPVRLARIDAWEVRGVERPLGLVARDAVRSMLPEGKSVVVETFKDKKGKYGRWIANIYVDGVVLNDWLVENKHARFAEY